MKRGDFPGAILISVLLHAGVVAAILWEFEVSPHASTNVEPISVEIVEEPPQAPAAAPAAPSSAPETFEGGPPPVPVQLNIGDPDTLEGEDTAAPEGTDDAAAVETATSGQSVDERPPDALQPAPDGSDAPVPQTPEASAPASSAPGETPLEPTEAGEERAVPQVAARAADGTAQADGETDAQVARAEPAPGGADEILSAPGSHVTVPPEGPTEPPPADVEASEADPDRAAEVRDDAEPAPQDPDEASPRDAADPSRESGEPPGPAIALPVPNPQRETTSQARAEPGEAEASQAALSEALRSVLASGAPNVEAEDDGGRAQTAQVAYAEAVRSAVAPVFWSAMRAVSGSGLVVVEVVIRRDGSVQSARIIRDSGDPALDSASLSAARTASYPSLPPAVDRDTLTVHIPLRAR